MFGTEENGTTKVVLEPLASMTVTFRLPLRVLGKISVSANGPGGTLVLYMV
ncbi:hypothetical protein D3C73_1038240 [compost metagenome]